MLVNDWSARDLQRWEYQPLGPFLGKSFATSISPWVVPLDALRRRRPRRRRTRSRCPTCAPRATGRSTSSSRWSSTAPSSARTNARGLYWTFPQQLAHATVNGAVARPGDLFASGTISGPERGSEGSLIELTRGGAEPLATPAGERTFLEDGDTVVLRSPLFGEVRGTIYG